MSDEYLGHGEECPNCGKLNLWDGIHFEYGPIKRCMSCDHLVRTSCQTTKGVEE